MEKEVQQDSSFPLGFQLFSHRELFSDEKEVLIGSKKVSGESSPRVKVMKSFKNSFENKLMNDVFNFRKQQKLPKILKGKELKVETEQCETMVIQALQESHSKIKIISPKHHKSNLNKRSKT